MLDIIVAVFKLIAYVVTTLTIATFLQGKTVPTWGAWVSACMVVYTLANVNYLYYLARIAVSSLPPKEE